MAYELPSKCPICQDVLAPDRTLEHHLLRSHSRLEVARYVARTEQRASVAPNAD